ncbi:MAG: hypothetical protein HY886_11040 [Deltaproteobacteria bacterium]|nr:hypothetical protein [Deltaproteobacteria bacterium]
MLQLALRLISAGLGLIMLARITYDLMDGEITYGVGDITVETVTTKGLPEAVALWASFSAIFIGLIILGARPRLFTEKKWLWKALLAVIFAGYVLSNVL